MILYKEVQLSCTGGLFSNHTASIHSLLPECVCVCVCVCVCYLFEIQSDGDPMKLSSVLDTRTLPPLIGPIDGIRDWMTF